MRTFLMLCLLALITRDLNAQIKTIYPDTITSQKEEIALYDSTNISTFKGKQYIGQRGIFYHNVAAKMLYTKDLKSFGGEKKYDAPLFTYFDVVRFNPPQEFELKRVDNGDVCFFTSFGDGTNPIILIPYYEQLKRTHTNTYRIIDDKDGVWRIDDIYLKSNGLKYLLEKEGDTIKIELGTLYGTLSYSNIKNEIKNKYSNMEWVVSNENDYGKYDTIYVEKGIPFCIFKNRNGDSYRFRIERTLKPTDLLPRFTKDEALKYIPKFGLKRWKEIINADVKIGMTKEMVILSVGTPIEVIKITDIAGKSENWRYCNMEVFFINDRVKQIIE